MDLPRTPPPYGRKPSLVLMWRGNIRAPDQPTNHAERFKPLVAALADCGVTVEPLAYFDDRRQEARERLLAADGVMVWINPVQDGQDRAAVDALLREVAASGVWVSAHPDTIAKLATKEVLYATRQLGWGSDTDLYRSAAELELRFPVKLAVAGRRVLKPLRGNDGKGVVKVERVQGSRDAVRVQSAEDDRVEELGLRDLFARLASRFDNGGAIVDQAFNDNAAAGMVRCYMSCDRVVGFSEQSPRISGDGAFGMASAKTMHGREAERFAALRSLMEQDWTPGLMRLTGLAREDLPALWDADFLHRATPEPGRSAFMLCEINASSVSPFPDAAAGLVAATVAEALARFGGRG